jgi:PKD repeat protein
LKKCILLIKLLPLSPPIFFKGVRMKVFRFLLFILFAAMPCLAQKEANEWFFGERCWVSFASGGPKVKGYTPLNTNEGSASICDEKGKLLFYSDGRTVWNTFHQPMPNGTGLLGGWSSTQSCVIVPNPAQKHIYYIFTSSNPTGGGTGDEIAESFEYSVVNMKLEGGRGDIEKKNLRLIDGENGSPNRIQVSEGVSATLDCSGKGYWAMSHSSIGNRFFAFHVTEGGVNPTPVISDFNEPKSDYGAAFIKFSPNSKMLALSNDGYPSLGLYNFDNATGIVSNKRELITITDRYISCFGVSFSPDNTKLYVNREDESWGSYRDSSLSQFTVNLPNVELIRASQVNFPTERVNSVYPLTLAPDGKIYQKQALHLGVIENPNLAGAACGYRDSALYLQGRWAITSLPNFPDFYFQQGRRFLTCAPPIAGFLFDTICEGRTITYRDSSDNLPNEWHWTFDGGLPSEYSGEIPPPIYYEKAGSYTTTLIVKNNYGSDTIQRIVTVRPLPIADAGNDIVLCPGTSGTLGSGAIAGNTYSWTPAIGLDNPNIAQPTVKPAFAQTTYFLKVTNQFGCESIDSVIVSVGSIIAKATPDTSVCLGNSIELTASGGSEYEWSPPDGLSATTGATVIASPLQTTEYRVIAKSGKCRDTTSVVITVNALPVAVAGSDKEICAGERVQIGSDAENGSTYLWKPIEGLSNATTPDPIATPLKTTEYIIEVINEFGCSARDTMLVKVENLLKVTANTDTAICIRNSVQLSATANEENLKYKWTPENGLSDPNVANPTATPEKTTAYTVTAFKNGGLCSAVDSVRIEVLQLPEVITKDITLCEGETAELFAESNDEIVQWSWTPATGLSDPNIQNPIITAFKNQTYYVIARNAAGCETTKSLRLEFTPQESITAVLKADKSELEPGESTTLHMLLKIENSSGVTSFKATVSFDSKVFKFADNSAKFVTGADDTWRVMATTLDGELYIDAHGQTPIIESDIALKLTAYLAKQQSDFFVVKVIEINGEEVVKPDLCRTVTEGFTAIILKDVCAGDLRLVNIGEFPTELKQVKPNPVSTESVEIEYSIGNEGDVALELYDAQGVLMKTFFNGNHKTGVFKTIIHTGELPAGIYFLKLSTLQTTYTQMFTVVK